jgi:hypothetical protein
VGEATQDNNDYIDSGANNSSTISLGLSGVTDPGTYANNHILRYACQSTGGTKGAERCDATVLSNGAPIAGGSTNNQAASRDAYAVVTLTILDATGIDYQNLSVELTSNVGAGESIHISWVEFEVPAAANSAPSVTTSAATVLSNSEATVGGNVSSDGNDPLTEVGVYYSTTSGFTPPGQGTKFQITPVPSVPPGDFSGNLPGLSAGTTYYYRAYAINGIGGTYETNQESFTTKDFPVMLATPTVTIESPTSATLGGTMTSDGFDTAGMVDCGVEWSETPGEPYEFSQSVGICTENNGFTTLVIDLTTGQDYYFRSYATNSVGTGYSNERQFRPVDKPSVTATIDVPSITDSSAFLGGDITNTGGDPVTAVGIIWDTDSDPINGGTDVPMTVADPFSQTVTGLPAGTPLWFVAYAANSAGPGYSDPATAFTTDPGVPTMDPTPSVTNVDVDSATLGGTMTSDGGGTISDCGVEWGTEPGVYGPPQSAGVCTENVAFSTPVTGLTTGLTHYFRAYASNGQGTDYSNERSFIPQGLPVVVSSPEANPSYNSADLGGNVTNDGGSTVTEHGIVWDTNPDPELQPTKTIVPIGEGTGPFSATVSLPPASTIYFEAYATNAAGTAYSDDNRSFPTGTEPTTQATIAAFANIAGTSVRITWARGNGEGVIVVLRETGTTLVDPQDAIDYAYNIDYTAAPEIPGNSQNFVVYKGAATSAWVTGLTMSTAYSVAVYEYAGSGASTDYRQTLPAEANDVTKDYASHNYDYRVDCTQCHGGHFGVIPRGDAQKDKCVNCHQLGQVAEAKVEFNNHLTPNRNPGIDQVDCGMCHELHNITGTLVGNTTLSENTITPGQAYNKSFLRANVGKYVDPNYSADKEAWPKAFLHNDTPKRTNDQGDVTQEAATPERAVEGGTAATSRGYCQVCHTQTAYHRNNPAAGASTPSAHTKAGFMQCHDGSTTNTACAPEVHCGDCHEHNNSFVGVNNNLPCQQCHDQPQPPSTGERPIITTMFDTANVVSSHIPNGTPTQPDCVVCHGQHTHDKSVYGLDADDGTTKWGTANPDTLATGAGVVFEPHCLSCHDGSADSLDGTDPDRTATSPFIGANPPPVIDQADWDASGHTTSPVTCVGNGANGCHSSGHGTDEVSLLATPAPIAGLTTNISSLCVNCHQSGGVSTIDVRSTFDPAISPAIWTTSDSNAVVNQRHDIFDSDQTGSTGSVSCAACHSPHTDNSTTMVRNPDTGDPLGTYDPANYGGGLDPSFGATEPDYIEFCLACHDGAGAPATTNVQAGGSVLSDDLYSIADKYVNDFHGNAFGGTGGNGFLKPPFQVDQAYAAMQCTMCHGAHGSDNIFNLKSSITVNGTVMSTGASDQPWGSKGNLKDVKFTTYTLEAAGGGTQTNMQWGAWCSFCHNMDSHSLDETKTCNGGHKHAGGKM